MKTIRVRSWSGFEKAIQRVRREHGVYRRTLSDGQNLERKTNILFRGQANHKWKLQTTLERKTSAEFNVPTYYARALRAKNELESFLGKKWEVPNYTDLETEIREKQDGGKVHLPAYEFLVYLRHHGYPSPLLDWTESPYVAAYFAYLNSGKDNPSVYCYIERPNLVKGGKVGDAMLSVMGPFVTTDKRHFAQKAWYTISTKWDYKKETHNFCPHELVFRRGNERQDLLVKIILPATTRTEALRKLNDYNINHFTLFQSEDSLVKALEMKHFDQNDV